MAQKLYNTKFVVTNMTKIVANDNQLHVSCIVINCKQQDFYYCYNVYVSINHHFWVTFLTNGPHESILR